jgi:hypothetical protein
VDPAGPPFDDPLTRRAAVEFGDRVSIRSTPVTVASGIAGGVGLVQGHTTPSLGYVQDVVGDPTDDVAINVRFDDSDVWIVPELVEFVDHAPGTTMTVGKTRLVRRANGSWEPDRLDPEGEPR